MVTMVVTGTGIHNDIEVIKENGDTKHYSCLPYFSDQEVHNAAGASGTVCGGYFLSTLQNGVDLQVTVTYL